MCFRGADLSALVREACVNALRVHLSSRPSQTHTGKHVLPNQSNITGADMCIQENHVLFFTGSPVRVSKVHFEDAFKKVRPSVSKKVSDMKKMMC